MNKLSQLDEQFLQAALAGDSISIKKYLEPKYQIDQLYEWPLMLKLRAFIYTPSVEICEILLGTGITDINAYIEHEETEKFRSLEKETALTVAITRNNIAKVEWLLNKSIDFNKPYLYEIWGARWHSKDYKLPLELACERGFIEIAKLLLKAGANINAKNKDGKTVLDLAKEKGYTEIVELLKQAGAKENKSFYQIKRRVLNEPDTFGETPLLKAIKKGKVEEVKNLITQGADVNFVNPFKESVLMLAVKKNQPEIVKLLIQAGVDVNYMDDSGKSILQLAEQEGITEIVKLLKQAQVQRSKNEDNNSNSHTNNHIGWNRRIKNDFKF